MSCGGLEPEQVLLYPLVLFFVVVVGFYQHITMTAGVVWKLWDSL